MVYIMKKFFRVECTQTYCLGGVSRHKSVGESVHNVYATPHAECVKNILRYNDNMVMQYENYYADQVVLIIEAQEYYNPEPNENYCELTDKDEVIVVVGTVVEVLSYHEFMKRF